MPKEIETKFKVSCLTALKKELRQFGAEFVSRQLEQDTYYFHPCGRSAFDVIRVRKTGKKGLFTIKSGRGIKASSTYKVRSEFEVAVDDANALAAMLERLGFKARFKKEKIRQTYKLKGAKILLDTLPYLGTYLEVEASRKTIKEVAKNLNLDIKKAVPQTYLQLFRIYKAKRKRPNLALVFK